MISWLSKKFSRKLTLAFCLPVILGMGVTGILLTRAMRDHLIHELTLSMYAQADLIASRLSPNAFSARESRRLHALAHELHPACGCRITFIRPDGLVLGDSDLTFEQLASVENHRGRPEVQAVLGGRKEKAIRHSHTVNHDLLYAAVPFLNREKVAGVVRVALPLTQVQQKINEFRSAIVWITLWMMLVAILAARWLSRSIGKPIQAMSRVAEMLAQGDYGVRAKPLGSDEVGKLGEALNLLADRVQHDMTQIRKLEQIRKDFVANVSHELRTPLAAIKGFAETLRMGALEDKKHRLEFVEDIESQADRMTRLVDDLLELSAIESGRRQPAFETVNVMDIARDVANGLKPLTARRKMAIDISKTDHLPKIQADKAQMRQVFTNLLDNAIKYSKAGGKIAVSSKADDRFVTIYIKDDGVGIPPQDLPRLFERFYRVDKARSREMGGTGLGLAIVKHIIETHGGTVGVDSAEGQGSTFRFSLPIKAEIA